MSLNIRRIDCSRDDAPAAIAALRRELSPRGNVVSPEGRDRTVTAFGEPLSPVQVVEKICADVAARGMAAVLDDARRLDGVALEPAEVRVPATELGAAYRAADAGHLATAVSREGLARLAPLARRLAGVEGLTAHRHGVDVRLLQPLSGES